MLSFLDCFQNDAVFEQVNLPNDRRYDDRRFKESLQAYALRHGFHQRHILHDFFSIKIDCCLAHFQRSFRLRLSVATAEPFHRGSDFLDNLQRSDGSIADGCGDLAIFFIPHIPRGVYTFQVGFHFFVRDNVPLLV